MSLNNNNKTNNPPTTHNSVTTNILLNSGTVQLSRFFDQDSTQQEDQDFLYNSNNDDSFRYNSGSVQNKEPNDATATSMDSNTNHCSISTTEPAPKMSHTESGFRTANDNPITPKGNRKTFNNPSKTQTTIVTPQMCHIQASSTTIQTDLNKKLDALEPTEGRTDFLHQNTLQIYDSPLLNRKYKPDADTLVLPPELDLLKPLILSQHEAFTSIIKDLGNITLTLTKIIEKKKESLHHLKDNHKIPRSLRLKCSLTSSPAYAENTEFLRLKGALQHEVTNFIQKGASIMTEWAELNISLLVTDRCASLLEKALQILDGLTSYIAEIIGSPTWPSATEKTLSFFLLKLYFSNNIFDTNDLVAFLEITSDKILIIGAKILTNCNSDEDAKSLIDSLNISEVDMLDVFQNTFVKETLLNFNQILKITTILIWTDHNTLAKQDIAANKLTAKIKAMATISATEATAEAITKATNNIEQTQSLNLATSIRLANLERLLKRQEQQTNELLNQNKRQKTEKNIFGSHQEPVTSPTKMAHLQNISKIVDLTQDSRDGSTRRIHDRQNSTPLRKKRASRRQQSIHPPGQQERKTVQWRDSESRNYNPDSPAFTTPFQQRAFPYTTTTNQHNGNSFLHPSHTPVHFFQSNPFNTQGNTSLHPGKNSQLYNSQGNFQQHNQTFPYTNPYPNKGNPFNNPFGNPYNQK
jgi:hypothetical protein